MIRGKGLDVLSINTYGGSLLVGAKMTGLPIRGSYEDVGYGSAIPKLNFPELNFIDQRKDWPQQNLSNTVVIAHPPCAAFSNMNNSPDKKGVNTDAFACTVSVMEYAMRNSCAGLAIESVIGAYEGGRAVHEKYARKYGYEVYRLLENAITYGIPQWRKRFWCLFVPKGSIRHFVISHRPKFLSVGELMMDTDIGPEVDKLSDQWRSNFEKLREKFSDHEIIDLFSGRSGFGLLPVISAKQNGDRYKTMTRSTLANRYHWDSGGFQCFWAKVLDPERYAPTLLGSSWWICGGRNLHENEYKAIMGFPRGYKYPEDRYRRDMRLYLSKGVCPPIAAHVIDILSSNLNGEQPSGPYSGRLLKGGRFHLEVKPGSLKSSTADFRIKEKEFKCL